ncbi:hypothetical protein AVEN_202538-1 [Araneus ventricosus]|uniref:Uncharacterized protein n=1 Tax=Araneus ventricosus TaxID=182803 RepID=A0A4Y2ISW5_ARAVE|nr:hypothetical protein AVEN_202538-1 [Araneus ventricosus]
MCLEAGKSVWVFGSRERSVWMCEKKLRRKYFDLYNSCFSRCLKENEVTGDAAHRHQAIREREMRTAETEQDRNRRFSAMAQHGYDRREEETV